MSVAVHRKVGAQSFQITNFVFLMLALLLAYSYALIQFLDDKTGFSYILLLGLVQITPFFFNLARNKVDYISIILLSHFATYTIPKYNQITNITKTGDLSASTVWAMQELIICAGLMLIGFYVPRLFLLGKRDKRFHFFNLNKPQLLFAGGYVLLSPLFGRFVPVTFLAIHSTILVSALLLMLTSRSPDQDKTYRLIVWMIYLSTIASFLNSGSLGLLGNLGGFLFLIGAVRKKLKLLAIPVALAVVASAIQTVKAPYRIMLNENPNAALSEKMNYLKDLLRMKYVMGIDITLPGALEGEDPTTSTDEDDDDPDRPGKAISGLTQGFDRLGDDSLERVLSWTPSRVPYWNGETYRGIPYMFIPRFLWPNKPARDFWNKFGNLYGYLSDDDQQTSVAVSWLAEGFMNFGSTGLYSIALIFGLFAALVEWFSFVFVRGGFYFPYLAFLVPLVPFANDFSTVVSSIVITTGVLMLFRTQFFRMALRDDYST